MATRVPSPLPPFPEGKSISRTFSSDNSMTFLLKGYYMPLYQLSGELKLASRADSESIPSVSGVLRLSSLTECVRYQVFDRSRLEL
jgi:hypothetical protein